MFLSHLKNQSENPDDPFELIKRIKQMTGNTLFLLHPWKRSANRRRCRIGERKETKGLQGGGASNGDYVKGSKLCTKKGGIGKHNFSIFCLQGVSGPS